MYCLVIAAVLVWAGWAAWKLPPWRARNRVTVGDFTVESNAPVRVRKEAAGVTVVNTGSEPNTVTVTYLRDATVTKRPPNDEDV